MNRDAGAAGCLGLIGAGCAVVSIVGLMAAFPVVFGVIVAAGIPGLIIAGWVIESRDRHAPSPAAPPQWQPGSAPVDARCLICRHALADDIITCVRCRTPHHSECVRFVGACSVYACRGRTASRAA